MRLWKKSETHKEGKYLVMRRDGTVPEWPAFVLGARDPAAAVALRHYAAVAHDLGLDPQYVRDVFDLADEFDAYRRAHGAGDPDGAPHRKDDPKVIEKMKSARGS